MCKQNYSLYYRYVGSTAYDKRNGLTENRKFLALPDNKDIS